MNTAALFAVLAFAWSIATLIKALAVLSRRESYKFAMWDGGLLLQGREMGRGGAIGFAVFCGVMICVSGYLLVKMGALR